MKTDFDIGIIGGGPAGSSAAIFLADAGFNVCLFERKIFPRETVCGEFLSNEVIEILSDIGIENEFHSLNPNKINFFRLINDNGYELSAELGFNAYGLKRSAFDNLLLQTAKKRGVKIFQPAEVKEIINRENYFEIIFSNHHSPNNYLRVRKVVSAYGKYSNLDKQLTRHFISEKSGLNGIKFHLNKSYLNNFNDDEIHIYVSEAIYCGINLVNDDTVTVCFLERRNNNVPVRNRIIELINSEPMRKIFSNDSVNKIMKIQLYGAGNIYFGKRNIIENGIFMIGDSAGIIAPLAGDGIAMAIKSAKILSEVFNNSNNNSRQEVLYKEKWGAMFNKRLKYSSVIQSSILKRWKRNMGITIISIFPQILQYLIKSTRN